MEAWEVESLEGERGVEGLDLDEEEEGARLEEAEAGVGLDFLEVEAEVEVGLVLNLDLVLEEEEDFVRGIFAMVLSTVGSASSLSSFSESEISITSWECERDRDGS